MTLVGRLKASELKEHALRAERRSYFSSALGAEQPFVLLRPSNSSERAAPEARYPLIVLLHGLGGSCEDWLEHTRVATATSGAPVFIVMPYGRSGWYTNAADDSGRYEDDVTTDLADHLTETLPLLPAGPAWAIGGVSMGGYGAVKLALKRPNLFGSAFALSGAFGVTRSQGVNSIFGDPEREPLLRVREDVAWLAEQAMCRRPTERPRLFLECGQSDPMLEESRDFSRHLEYLGYRHGYREMPGRHTWPYWDRGLRAVLPEIVGLVSRPLSVNSPEGSIRARI